MKKYTIISAVYLLFTANIFADQIYLNNAPNSQASTLADK